MITSLSIKKFIADDRFFRNKGFCTNTFLASRKNVSIEEFSKDFPSVSKEQAVRALEIANKIVNSVQLNEIYEGDKIVQLS
jgi:hypothetical protein